MPPADLAAVAPLPDATLEDLRPYAGAYPRVPVWMTIPDTGRSPSETFRVLKRLSHQCYILQSAEPDGERGRYTFLGHQPVLGVSIADGRLTLDGVLKLTLEPNDPGAVIDRIIADNACPIIAGLPPFTGGLVGYISYDYARYAEPALRFDAADTEGFRDLDLMFFDRVIAYDHATDTIVLIALVKTDALEENYHHARAELADLARLIATGEMADFVPLRLTSPWREMFDEERFSAMVEQGKHFIHEGDIFQVVLSNRLDADATGSLFTTYERLREINPSPYMFYFSSDDLEIAGASPETLVRYHDGRALTFPLAGSRPRGSTPEEDARLEAELLADPKELAEHRMLVDLGRNDIGRIAEYGTVRVDDYMSVSHFSHVMHIGSTVSGVPRPGVTARQILDSVLPAGTLSGAPKIRAMEIIDQLEGVKRGVYGGAIGYIGVTGEMDTCIAIRLAFKKDGVVYVRSGAGVVADSVPAAEYAETRAKARAVMTALEEASA
ncbi:MAG: anthranilate synthase component I family protein [Propionibacteriaceae bacterium]|nr:anthranilate synthase component I family protein [Propionibacteriaceae bacterium]